MTNDINPTDDEKPDAALEEKRRQIHESFGAWAGTDAPRIVRELREESRRRPQERWGLDTETTIVDDSPGGDERDGRNGKAEDGDR